MASTWASSFTPFSRKSLWNRAATAALTRPARSLPPALGAEDVGQGGRQPVAQLMARAAVDGLDEGLAVLVVPEADASRLPVLNAAASGRLLAVVVVEAVHSLAELDEELVGGR